jgi:monoamine oxidase
MMALFEWATKQCESWDPSNKSKLANAELLDNVTLEEYCTKHIPGRGAWFADKLTEGLLGVNSDEVSALYMIDYWRSGTGLLNMMSDQKDGGQYIRNRKGKWKALADLVMQI